MYIGKYFPEMTIDSLNAAISACSVRLEELKELYFKCKNANQTESAKRIYDNYIALKIAIINLHNAEYKYIEMEEEKNVGCL